MEETNKPHKRRVRYKGTHPRNYREKYKEHNPEKYQGTIEKVIAKGSTPAGMHLSICVEEILAFLQIRPGQKGLDATLGYGGHATEMLKALKGEGHLYGMDVDPIELPRTTKRLEEKGFGPAMFTPVPKNFAAIDEVVAEVGKLDFILADLGVSSMQIDNPERGFSYKTQGPLDLRLNPEKGISAAERLKEMDVHELRGMLEENADEPEADKIAKAIISAIKKGKAPQTTGDLRDIIAGALSHLPKSEQKEAIKKACQRSFQALRIDVNSEFEVLYDFLEKLPSVLAPGGRVAILSFHSGEDRLVKKAFKRGLREGIYQDIAPKFIRPGVEECARNPRAKSTKFRWAIKA